MYEKKTHGGHCCSGGVYYPKFGGDLGSERHWDVDDVKQLLFGAFDAEQSQDLIAVRRINRGYNPSPLRLVP